MFAEDDTWERKDSYYPDSHKERDESDQFSVSKHFVLTIFVVISVITFILISIYVGSLKDNLLKRSERGALATVRNVIYRYHDIIINGLGADHPVSSMAETFGKLDSIIKEKTFGFDIVGFNIYSSDGRLFYGLMPGLYGVPLKKRIPLKNFKGIVKASSYKVVREVRGNHTVISSFIPIKGKGGELLGVFEILQDVTELFEQVKRSQFFITFFSVLIMALLFVALLVMVKRAEFLLGVRAAKFESQKKYLATILSNMGNAVVIVDRKHNVKYMNEQAVAFFGKRDRFKCYEAFLGAQKPCRNCYITELIDKEVYKKKSRHEDKKGRIFEVTASVIHDEYKGPLLIEIFNDITELVRAQKDRERFGEVVEKERMDAIRELIASLKHKINNSLTGMLAIIDYLESQDRDKPHIEGEDVYGLLKEEIDRIKETLKRLSRLKVPKTAEYITGETMIDLDG